MASGHVGGFSDRLMGLPRLQGALRADQLIEAYAAEHGLDVRPDGVEPGGDGALHRRQRIACPECGKTDFTGIRKFNLMFKTFQGRHGGFRVGRVPAAETAQGIFVNFRNVQRTHAQEDPLWHRADRKILPQRDHAGQLHVPHARVRADGAGVLLRAGDRPRLVCLLEGVLQKLPPLARHASENMRLREHEQAELSHYSKGTTDIEFLFPFGLGRAVGHRRPHGFRPQVPRRAQRREL